MFKSARKLDNSQVVLSVPVRFFCLTERHDVFIANWIWHSSWMRVCLITPAKSAVRHSTSCSNWLWRYTCVSNIHSSGFSNSLSLICKRFVHFINWYLFILVDFWIGRVFLGIWYRNGVQSYNVDRSSDAGHNTSELIIHMVKIHSLF